MHHLVVDGGAYGSRVVVVPVEVGGSSQFQHGALEGRVHLGRGHAGARGSDSRIEGAAGDDSGTSHLLKLCVGFDFDSCHDTAPSGLGGLHAQA